MKNLKLFLAGAVAVAMVACTGGQKKAHDHDHDHDHGKVEAECSQKEKAATDYIGIYEGTLPCADCPGIKTVLTIKDDGTYNLVSEYLEKENGVSEQSATYTLVHNGEVIELFTPSSGDKIYYRILDGALALTAEDGVLNDGELAQHYKLKKK